jgi:dolichyl-phosphate beta-glucosyltransferase
LRSLSIIIPAFNEESRLPATIDELKRYLGTQSFSFLEIVIVDDGSRDSTAALVERTAAAWPVVRLLKNPGNRGKGYAVRHGMLEAKGDWVLFSDADLSAPIAEVEKLLAAVDRERADAAIGSRALDRSLVTVHQSALREFSGRFFNVVMRVVAGLPFRDTQCGFKLFRRGAAQDIFSRVRIDGFGFDVEALFIARKRGFKTVEVPVRWANVEGTKVSLANGLNAFADLVRIRCNQLKGLYR